MPRDEPSSAVPENGGQPPNAKEPTSSKPKKWGSAPWIRLTGAGMELAFITLVFGALGAVVDGQLQTDRPVVSAIAGLVGFSFGMFRFIRLATSVSAAQRDEESQRMTEAETNHDQRD